MLRAAAWEIIQASAELSNVAVMKKFDTLSHWAAQAAQHISQSSTPPPTTAQARAASAPWRPRPGTTPTRRQSRPGSAKTQPLPQRQTRNEIRPIQGGADFV